MREIKTVTVIGANGSMGKLVSAIFASFGDAKVYMVSREIEKSKIAVESAMKSVRAQSIEKNLIAADYSTLKKSISESDFVLESIKEDFGTKYELNKEVSAYLQPGSIFATGTSGLSINRLAQALTDEQKKRYMGVHFFNPPYNMRLCELIPSDECSLELIDEVKSYLEMALRRAVVVLNDMPAFLGNRIGFQFLNEALINAERFATKGGIDYIDAIFGPFTGRGMLPLITSDFVGLDVHKAIVDNIHSNTNDIFCSSFEMPLFARRLIDQGRLGRKAGEGLYRKALSEEGKPIRQVYDIEADEYRAIKRYSFGYAAAMSDAIHVGDYKGALEALLDDKSPEGSFCLELLLEYIVYSVYLGKLVADSVHASDVVMAEGFNWCPPLAMKDAFETVCDFITLAQSRLPGKLLEAIDAEQLLSGLPCSKYDFRSFFRS